MRTRERKLVLSFPLDCQRAIIACKKEKNRESKSLLSIAGRREREEEEEKNMLELYTSVN